LLEFGEGDVQRSTGRAFVLAVLVPAARHLGGDPVEVGDEGIEFREVGDTTDSALLVVDKHHEASLPVSADAEVELVERAVRDLHGSSVVLGETTDAPLATLRCSFD